MLYKWKDFDTFEFLIVSTLISAENLSKSFSERPLFRNISLGIHKGQRIALAGINGSGKSTLLKILAGIEQPDEGKVVISKGLRIGYLEQSPSPDKSKTVGDIIFSDTDPLAKLTRQYEQALAVNSPELERLVQQLDDLKGWDYENRAHAILSRMGIPEPNRLISSLSGGQLRRLSFASLLLKEPGIYLLDEPTNHLDIETIEWLEKLLSEQNKTILMVTHDRYFLDQVATEIIELERGQVQRYKGKYNYYLEKKAELELNKQAAQEKAQNLLRKELEWMRRQPKARTTKSKARIEAFSQLKEESQKIPVKQELQLSINTSRQGSKILELHRIGKSYDSNTIVNSFSYVFKKGDRIGLVGNNGSGKTTFLNLVTGADQPDKGKIIQGETTIFGYYKQEGFTFKEDQRIIDVVREVADHIEMNKGRTLSASQLLSLFLFPPPVQYNPVIKLSGGERKRLQLLRILMKNPNFLILDEPTNDLDMATMNILEDFLTDFGGCLVLVSHDRYFMDIIVDQVFAFEGNGEIRIFPGNYTEYKNQVEEEQAKELKKPEPVRLFTSEKAAQPTKKKLSYKDQKEYEQLENEIASLEKNKIILISELSHTTDHARLTEIGKQLEAINSAIEAKTDRWMELAEYL